MEGVRDGGPRKSNYYLNYSQGKSLDIGGWFLGIGAVKGKARSLGFDAPRLYKKDQRSN